MYKSWNTRLTKLREAQTGRSNYFMSVNNSILSSEPHQTVLNLLQGIHLNNFQKPTSTTGTYNLNFDFTSYQCPIINEASKIYKSLVHAKACSSDLTEMSVNFVINYMHSEMNFEIPSPKQPLNLTEIQQKDIVRTTSQLFSITSPSSLTNITEFFNQLPLPQQNLLRPKLPANITIITEAINRLNGDDVVIIALWTTWLIASSIKINLEKLILIILGSFVRAENISQMWITKKDQGFRVLETSQSVIPIELEIGLFRDTWQTIKCYIDTTSILPEHIITFSSTKLSAENTNVHVFPLLNQAYFKNLTSIKTICDAISNYPNFPWATLYDNNPAVAKEFNLFNKIISAIATDKLIGYKIPGIASNLPNLSYIAVQLDIVVGGNEDLKQFQGTGSKTTKGVNKTRWDDFINKFANDPEFSGADYDFIKDQYVKRLNKSLPFAGLTENIKTFITIFPDDDDIPRPQQEDNDENPRGGRGGGGGGNDDDNNPGNPPPGNPPRRQSNRDDDVQSYQDKNLKKDKDQEKSVTISKDIPGTSKESRALSPDYSTTRSDVDRDYEVSSPKTVETQEAEMEIDSDSDVSVISEISSGKTVPMKRRQPSQTTKSRAKTPKKDPSKSLMGMDVMITTWMKYLATKWGKVKKEGIIPQELTSDYIGLSDLNKFIDGLSSGNFESDRVAMFRDQDLREKLYNIEQDYSMDPAMIFMTAILTMIQHPNERVKKYNIPDMSIKNVKYTNISGLDFVGVAYYMIVQNPDTNVPETFRFRHPMHLTRLNKGIADKQASLIDLDSPLATKLLSRLSDPSILEGAEIGVAGSVSDKPLADYIILTYCS